MRIEYFPIGFDCSPAEILRRLELRKHSLPFDWCQTTLPSIAHCIEHRFRDFFQGLRPNPGQSRLVDRLGIQFPHDFPTTTEKNMNNPLGYAEARIVDDWESFVPEQIEKYQRRSIRFLEAFENADALIFVHRGRNLSMLKQFSNFISQKRSGIPFAIVTLPLGEHVPHFVQLPREEESWNELGLWAQGLEDAKTLVTEARNRK